MAEADTAAVDRRVTALLALLLVLQLKSVPSASECAEVWQLVDLIEKAPDRVVIVSQLIVKPGLHQKVVAANNFLTLGGHADQLARACAI